MTEAEREARIREYLKDYVWPTEDEMRVFIKECEENPHSIEDLIVELEAMSSEKLAQVEAPIVKTA